ncbi:MAG: hypothetical protein GC204_16220 [Chloroflexi bacterium]|nr:hypothetical protein [Chloroflexota bacterium]
MPFEVKWYVEGRVSSARDWGDLTLEEMRESNVISLEHIRAGTPPVHLLIDTRAVGKLPGSFVPMLKEIESFRHEKNMGWTIMVTNSSLLHFFGVLSSNLIKMPFSAVSTYEEANLLLKKVDPSLEALLPEKWEASAP